MIGSWRSLFKNFTCIEKHNCAAPLFVSFNKATNFFLRTRALQVVCHSDPFVLSTLVATWQTVFPKTSLFIEPTKTRNSVRASFMKTWDVSHIRIQLRAHLLGRGESFVWKQPESKNKVAFWLIFDSHKSWKLLLSSTNENDDFRWHVKVKIEDT